MHDSHAFLQSLTVVLAVAAVTTVVFQRLHQPVVLGYILAGLIVGPHVPIPLVADPEIVETLSELGVILLMFSLGLEFSLPKLVTVGPTAGVTALVQFTVMAWLGYLTGRLFGWTALESVFTGALIAISSTTIIAKVFDEQRVAGRVRELVIGILLIEDLLGITSMAVLTTVAAGVALSAATLAPTLARLFGFLLALLVGGMLVVPRFMRVVFALQRPETTLVASVGICFVTAWIAQQAGYSVALGAFLAGSLIAESGRGDDIEHLVRPVRDMFLAIFFVSVGLLIDPALVAQHWAACVTLTVVVIVGKVGSVALGAFLTGSGVRTAVQTGMSLAQIGEFSYIIASLGLALGATREFLYPVAVAVSAITTLTTPWLIRSAEPVAEFVDRRLPPPLQTFASLYGTWIERLRTRSPTGVSPARRAARLLVLDVAALSALVIGAALGRERATAWILELTGVDREYARHVVTAGVVLLSLPLLAGIWRLAQRLGAGLAEAALPRTRAGVDFDAAPRRALVTALQLSVVLVCGLVVVAVTQPVLPGYAGLAVLGLIVVVYAVAFVRSTVDLEGHVQAGSLAVLEALTKYARAGRPSAEPTPLRGLEMLSSLGTPVAIVVDADSPAAGRTLADLNLRGRTGATVLAIARGSESIATPSGDERLREGDIVGLTGTHEAIAAASAVLRGERPPDGDSSAL